MVEDAVLDESPDRVDVLLELLGAFVPLPEPPAVVVLPETAEIIINNANISVK